MKMVDSKSSNCTGYGDYENSISGSRWQSLPLQKYAGFNALELMLVLAVIAVGIGVALHTMSGNSDKQNANQMVSDVATLVSNIENAYGSSTVGYTNLTTASVIEGKLVPADLKISSDSTTIQNQFQGGTVTADAGTDASNFVITYSNVPSSVCSTAVPTLVGSEFLSISINDTEVYSYDSTPDLDGAVVASACSQLNNSVVFTAR
ncbi:MAG: hypothetical protein QG673_380 [Pseudomonadota bacterium]|nr:hypothetical protein [Pseudomonadota bacterium]